MPIKRDYASVDFETKTRVYALPEVGVHKYVQDIDFDIYRAGFAMNDEEPEPWRPGMKLPRWLVRHIERGGILHAWNAMFERVTWGVAFGVNRGFIVPETRQWRCTMVRALACGLPGRLETAAICLKVKQRKDTEGSKAMMKLMRPINWKAVRKDPKNVRPIWHTEESAPDLYKTTEKYCLQDVRTERACGHRLPYLVESEERQYWYDQKIADRGIRIDTDLCKAAIKIANVRRIELNEKTEEAAGIKPTQVAKIKEFAEEQGFDLPNVKEPTVQKALKNKELPDKLRQILMARLEAGKTSVSKYETALEWLCEDGKIRGQRQFYGGHTGRWSGRGVQLDNLMRPTMKPVDEVVMMVRHGQSWLLESAYDNVMEPVANATRSILIADEDEELHVADFKSIESRTLAETSGQKSTNALWRISDRGEGPDVYLGNGANMFGEDLQRLYKQYLKGSTLAGEIRFWGKTAELALGYEGGVNALIKPSEKSGARFREIYAAMRKNAGERVRSKVDWMWEKMGPAWLKLEIGNEKDWKAARYVVERWRGDNYMTVILWSALREASVEAMRTPGKSARVVYADPKRDKYMHDTGVSFRYDKGLNMLFCKLRSGRFVTYPFPQLITAKDYKGNPQMQVRAHFWNTKFKQFMRYHPYGGHLCENITQAHARDIMASRFEPLERAGYKLLHTVHDEVICANHELVGSSAEFARITAVAPSYFRNMPIAVDAMATKSYYKQ